ncbi:MAG: hypothetical protein ACLFSC_09095 [Wenzhouxiangella sp.]
MAQAVQRKSPIGHSILSALRNGGRVAGELLALTSMGAGLLSTLLLAASLLP